MAGQWAFQLQGPAEEGVGKWWWCVCVRARLCTFLGLLRVTRPPTNDPFLRPLRKMLLLLIADPRESFAEQVSGVKLVGCGLGVGVR